MSTPPCENRRVAIIGSGLAGLTCAVRLAHEGCKVTVFEKNEELGGRMGALKDRGFTWDSSPSPLTKPEILIQLWRSLGRKLEDYLKLVPLSTACRYFWADGARIDDDAEFRERPEVARFLRYGKGAHEIAGPFVSWQEAWWRHINPETLATLRHLPKLLPGQRMHGVTAKILKDPKLVQLFDHFATRMGSSPFSAPAVLTYMAYLEAEHGTWHVEGGTHRIIEALLKIAGELGVELKTGCEVTGIFDSSIAIAGKWKTFDAAICNQDVLMAYQSLLPRKRCGVFRDAYLNRYRTSFSSYVLHLGIDREYPQLSHRNVLFSGDQRREFRQLITERVLADEPTIELTVSSRTEPALAPVGCENWSIRIDSPPMRSSLQWEALGETVAERILDRLEKSFGFDDLRKHIIARKQVTPADSRHQYLCFGGCDYGYASHNLRNTLIGPAMEPPGMTGFYFVGSSMRPSGGIPQVIQGAHHAVAKAIQHLKHTPVPKEIEKQ